MFWFLPGNSHFSTVTRALTRSIIWRYRAELDVHPDGANVAWLTVCI